MVRYKTINLLNLCYCSWSSDKNDGTNETLQQQYVTVSDLFFSNFSLNYKHMCI